MSLTAEQQAALDQFDQDADAANETLAAYQQAKAEIDRAREAATAATTARSEALAKAVESAQAFVDAMLPDREQPAAGRRSQAEQPGQQPGQQSAAGQQQPPAAAPPPRRRA